MTAAKHHIGTGVTFKESVVRPLATPRGIAHSIMAALLLLNIAFGLGWIKVIAGLFFLYIFLEFAMRNFRCPKAGLGFIAAISILAVAFTASPKAYAFAFTFMFADAWLHSL